MSVEQWPTCSSSITVDGFTLACVLPRHHELDGETMHRTTGEHGTVSWSMTLLRLVEQPESLR